MSTISATDLEFDRLKIKVMEAMRDFEEGENPKVAYEKLVSLPQPETEDGEAFMFQVRIMQTYIRAWKMAEEGDLYEAKECLNQFLCESEGLKQFDTWRDFTQGFLALTTVSKNTLTEPELANIKQSNLAQLLYFQVAIEKVTPELQLAIEAMRLGRENDFDKGIARVDRLIDKAKDEYPQNAEMLDSWWLVIQFIFLSEKMIRHLTMIEIEDIYVTANRLQQKTVIATELFQRASRPTRISWLPQFADVYDILQCEFVKLANLLMKVLGKPVDAEHLKLMEAILTDLQNAREKIAVIKGNKVIVDNARGQFLEASSVLMTYVENLNRYIKPSRESIISISGLAAAICFLIIVSVLFLLSNQFGLDLNTTFVITIGSFLGLIVGFGYGALRFREWFVDVLKGSS